jgi:hypothetical protein
MKKIAFSLSFVLLFTSILFVSCGDDDEVSTNSFVRFKVDGTLREFKNQNDIDAFVFNVGVTKYASILGESGMEEILLMIYDDADITTTTYSGFNDADDGPSSALEGVIINYIKPNGSAYSTTVTNTHIGTITITKLTSAEMEGTFSASLRNPENESEVVSITEGEFLVKLSL